MLVQEKIAYHNLMLVSSRDVCVCVHVCACNVVSSVGLRACVQVNEKSVVTSLLLLMIMIMMLILLLLSS